MADDSPENFADPNRLAEKVLAGDRLALARAITIVESTRQDHRHAATVLLERLLSVRGPNGSGPNGGSANGGGAIRLGISGSPGVGKSTFIESFGLRVIEQGHKVAVLAIDPSSQRSGGSILGDKTRMPGLAQSDAAFVRPSPTGGTLGGVARHTREALLVCEAAGFDVVIVETVGVGQSETAVADMVDMFLLLLQPGGGDELQGLKKGIVELADLILVNKADGDLTVAADQAAAEYRNALQLLRPMSPNWRPEVLTCSALTGQGVPAVWVAVERYREALGSAGALAAKRAEQARAWMWAEINETLMQEFQANDAVAGLLAGFEDDVMAGRITPTVAAQRLLRAFLG